MGVPVEAGIATFLFVAFAALFGLALTAFWIWMLVEAATKEPNEGNEKIVWILIIALLGALGAIVYFFVRRPKRITVHGS
jgi:hypothetical protein